MPTTNTPPLRQGESPPIVDIDISKLPIPKDIISDTSLIDELEINEAFPGLIRGQATAVLIDVNNLYRRSKAEGFTIDYTRIKNIIGSRCDLRYFAVVSAVDIEDPAMHPWIEKLRGAGITPITKPVKRYLDDLTGDWVFKGNMDVELTIAALTLSDGFAHVIIGSCDGDFIPLIKHLRNGNFRTISVLGVSNFKRKGMNEDLIRYADNFYDLRIVEKHISAGPGDR